MNMQNTYTNIVEIGSGGGGTVFRAYHVRMQKYVVLKKIHDSIQNNIDIRSELDILKNLRHSYLPTVLDFFEDNGSIYTVMDYIPGESFESMLRRGVRFPQAKVVKYAAQLGEVLTYLQEQPTPIIHGDIKPANLMLTPEDNICLIDFNISTMQNGTSYQNMGYTAGYASPEQISIVKTLQQHLSAQGNAPQATMPQMAAPQGSAVAGTVLLNPQGAAPQGSPVAGTVLLNPQGTAPQATMPQMATPQGSAVAGTVLLNPQGTAPQAAAPQMAAPQGSAVAGTVLLNPQGSAPQASMPQMAAPQATIPRTTIPQLPPMKEKLDVRSDLYSVGATLYAMLTGMAPNEDFKQIVPIEQLIPNCSEGLAHLIHRCMEYNPGRRFANAKEYAKAVAAIAKVDKRYKRMVRRQDFTVVLCILGMAGCIVLTIFGRERIIAERIGVYNGIVAQMEELQGSGDTSEFERLYEDAVSRFPKMAGAYYQKALYLYNTRQYEQMVSFIDKEVFSNSSEFSDEETGGFYFLLANGYLEQEMLSEAVGYYKTAVRYDPYDSTYYSDYAIALAKTGELEKAEKILAEAEQRGLSSDKVLLAEGEIKGRRGLTDEAADCFSKCIELTEDPYVVLRAYIMWGKLYDAETPTEELLFQKAEVLTQAAEAVSEDNRAVVLEQLAQTYIDLGDLNGSRDVYLQAIDCLNQIAELGWDTYVTHNNIGILYQRIGEYEQAQQEFTSMLEKYGEDYRTYKRLAFLEIDKQSVKENRSRDYAQFLAYYQKAKELFADSGARQDSDMEMQLLEQAYAQLKEGNWLD